MDEIVGIGSCLSEQVARHFAMNFWGRSVSMVRHNRSDQLVPILNGQAPPKYQDLIDIFQLIRVQTRRIMNLCSANQQKELDGVLTKTILICAQ